MAITAGTIRIDLIAGTAAFFGDLDRAGRQLDRKLSRMGRSAERSGRTLFRSLTLPIAALGAATAVTAGKFELSMNRVRALTRATGKDFDDLRGLALDLGKTTQFSASEAADGMGYLAQAGFETSEILASMPTVLNLAAGAQIDLARSADLASNIIAGFGLDITQLSDATDVLSLTFSSSNTDLEQLAEAFKIAGPVASAAGLSFTETSAIIGKMGDAGFQASLAGTALRGAIARLLLPTVEAEAVLKRLGVQVLDSGGDMRSLIDIVDDLRNSGASAGDVLEIFGQRAGPAMQTLVLQGADSIRELEASLKEAKGTTKELADVQMAGLIGAARRMRSAFEGMLISIGDSGFTGALTGLANSASAAFLMFGLLDQDLQLVIVSVAGLAAAIGPLLIVIGLLLPLVGKSASLFLVWMSAIASSSAAVAGLYGGLALLAGFLGGEFIRATNIGSQAVAGLSFAMNAALLKYQQLTGELTDDQFRDSMFDLFKLMEDMDNRINDGERFDLTGHLEKARNAAQAIIPSLGKIFDLLGTIGGTLRDMSDTTKGVDEDVDAALKKIGDLTPEARKSLDELRAALAEARGDIENIGDETEKTFGQVMLDAIEGWSRQASNAVAEFAVEGKTSIEELGKSFLKMLIGFATQQLIFAPLFAGLGAAFGSIGAGGAAVNPGPGVVYAHAKGDYLDSPVFGVGGGGLHVAGEAGGEYVMPAGRDKHGNMGVIASGGGGAVVQIIDQRGTGEPVGVSREQSPDGREMIRVMIRDAVRSEFSSGGFDQTVGQTYGLRRSPTRR